MLQFWKSTGTLIVGALLGVFAAHPARATGLEECGNAFVRDSDAQCEFRTAQHCSETCSYGAVQSACVAEIYEDCAQTCTEVATPDCENQCQETCTTHCTQAPADASADDTGAVQCEQLCVADCEVSCTDPCGSCDEACLYTCSARCEDQCRSLQVPDEQAPECNTTCATACTASCTAQANSQCQIDCQKRVLEECEPTLVERCLDQCQVSFGAIFCEGQFIDSADVEDCATQIETETGNQVDRSDVPAAASTESDEPGAGTDPVTAPEKFNGCSLHRGASPSQGPLLSMLILMSLAALPSLRRKRATDPL